MNELNMAHLFFSGILGGIIVASVVLIFIQKCGLRRGKFDTIECSTLKVVGFWDGKARVILTTDDRSEEYNNGERVIVSGGETGASVILRGTDANANTDKYFGMVTLRAFDDGGRMWLGNADGSTNVWLGSDVHGGYVRVFDKDGRVVFTAGG